MYYVVMAGYPLAAIGMIGSLLAVVLEVSWLQTPLAREVVWACYVAGGILIAGHWWLARQYEKTQKEGEHH